MTTKRKDFIIGVLCTLISVIIWSGNYVIAKGISKQIPPISIAFIRWTTASAFIFPIGFKAFLRERNFVFQHKFYFFLTALLGVGLFNTFIYLAGHHTSAINLALIGATGAPIFITLLSYLLLKDHVGGFRILGISLCVLGILILLCNAQWQQLLKFHFGKGDLLMILSALSFAFYNLLVRKKPTSISPIVLLFVIFILGSFIIFPFYVYEASHHASIIWTPNLYLIMLYLGLGNSVIGFLCWNVAIRKIGPSRTAIFSTLIPILSSLEAVWFLGEAFTKVHIISGLVLISGLIIANLNLKST